MHLATAVIGAGPAGLLFCAVARLLAAKRGGDPKDWPLRLYDKRDRYARTHRLRMAPEPYRAIQRDLDDPRFDAIVGFLEAEEYRPEVNRLEEKLAELCAELGVQKERLVLEPHPQSLASVREKLEHEGALASDTQLTIVGADSVHSTVREMVRGNMAIAHRVHQQVARLRVIGPGLPERLGAIEQVRLSKILGSILDYRRNANGFAEVDLFLAPADHASVRELGASPKDPLRLTASGLSRVRAPLFRRIVEHLEDGFGSGRCEVLLQSSFVLEHAMMPRLTFVRPDLRATVFLLGDAAVSLPFFRGMACLARCVHSLAHVHCDLWALAAREAETLGETEAQIERYFRSASRPKRFGAWFLPGRIVEVRPTLLRGVPSFAVLHRFGGRWGAHVLERTADGWRPHRRITLAGRQRASEAFECFADPALRYDLESNEVKEDEMAVVRARARLVALVRELSRVSALLPFPVQSWFLSVRQEHGRQPRSRGLFLNAALALLAAALALAAPALAVFAGVDAAWLALLSLVVQAIGGVAYHAVDTLEGGPNRAVRAVWRAQTVVLFALGLPLAVLAWRRSGFLGASAASAWLVLAAMFVVGLYVYERIVARWLGAARPDDQR